MTNAKIQLISGGTKTFKVEGLLRVNLRKSQQTPVMPIPTQKDDKAVLTSVMGQTTTLVFDLSLFERSDDYSDGTHSVGSAPYSIDAQKQYLLDTIFATTGVHKMILTDGVTEYSGRIQDIQFVDQGDEPLSQSCIISFTRGVSF